MPEHTQLKVPLNTQAGSLGLSDQLRVNICNFLDWSLAGLGYFLNVYRGTTYPYGGNPSTLRLSDDKRYTKGSVWDCFKTNLLWESGVEGSYQPIQISGIYVNNTFHPTGTFSYNINYPNGRVIFNNPISTNSIVQMEYSYRYYNVYPDTIQWFKNLTEHTFRLDDPQFSAYGSGIWSTYPESRAQLPAIVVEPVPQTDFTPYQLGGGQWLWQDVLFHVFAENGPDRDSILDILRYQNEKKFFTYDINMVNQSGVWPLSPYGYLSNASYNYPYLINNFLSRFAIVRKTNIQLYQNNPQCVWYGVARWKLQIEMPEI